MEKTQIIYTGQQAAAEIPPTQTDWDFEKDKKLVAN